MLIRLFTYTLVATISTILSGEALAQQPAPDLSIINARIIVGTGITIEEATINLSGNRIQTVSDGDSTPRGDIVIDAAGKTVLPGLIDAHKHLLVNDFPSLVSSDSAMKAGWMNSFTFLIANLRPDRDRV